MLRLSLKVAYHWSLSTRVNNSWSAGQIGKSHCLSMLMGL